MDESSWERYAALGGIVFVVLNVIGAFLAGSPPSLDDSPQEIAKFFNDHAGALQAAQVLGGIGIIGLFWWFGSLWRKMARAEDERPRLAVVALIGLAIGAVFALSSGAITSLAAMRIDDLGPGGAKVFFAYSTVLLGTAGFGIVAFVSAVSALSYKTALFPQWVTIIGWIVGAGFLVSTLASASDADVFTLTGLLSFLLFCVWILAISVLMFRGAVRAAPAVA
jgi:hypothetical protein